MEKQRKQLRRRDFVDAEIEAQKQADKWQKEFDEMPKEEKIKKCIGFIKEAQRAGDGKLVKQLLRDLHNIKDDHIEPHVVNFYGVQQKTFV